MYKIIIIVLAIVLLPICARGEDGMGECEKCGFYGIVVKGTTKCPKCHSYCFSSYGDTRRIKVVKDQTVEKPSLNDDEYKTSKQSNRASQATSTCYVCPNCLEINEFKVDPNIESILCSNEKCLYKMKTQEIFMSSYKDAKGLRDKIKDERTIRAKKMKIREITAVRCPYCKDKIHLSRLNVLDMIEGRHSRTITCDIKSCGRSYDILDGVKTYEEIKRKEYRDFSNAILIAAACTLVVAAAASGSSGGGGYTVPHQVYVPSYTRSDGTVVRSYYRTYPDGIIANNYGQPSYAQLQQYRDLNTLPTYMYDFDGDGTANQYDFDDDNDGIGDNSDREPYNSSVW